MSHRTRYSSEGFVKGEFNLPEVEKKILSFWRSNQTFERSLERRKGKKKFVFYEGPPYANGKPGIHHVLARIYKDIILRYKTMRGYLVPRKAGWDTHGLPVEIAAEKALGLKSKRDIEKFGVEKFNEKAKEAVWIYKDEWERLTERIGYWLDLKSAYVTYKSDYIETLWWILKRLWEKKLLYRGHKVISWCPRCGTSLSSHELAQGYKEMVDQSVYVKFKLDKQGAKRLTLGDRPVYVLSWTTTPWTLPGNVALAVGKDIKYAMVLIEKTSEVLVVATELMTKIFGELLGKGAQLYGKVLRGKDLVGLEYEPLFDIPALKNENSYKIYAADFVTTTDGTGVVHTAVMYGEDDYKLGLKVGLPQHHTVDESGKFTKEVRGLAGLFVKSKETEEKIFSHLEKQKNLLKIEPYTHEYPLCWRCETPTLYYARDSWFIAMSKLRAKLLQNNKKINWVPAYLKEGRFGEWLREAKEWNLSRERYWGVPLPIWKCRKCGHEDVIGSFDELSSKIPQDNAFYFVRHGEATSNIDGICGPPRDTKKYTSRLTKKGIRQVEQLAASLKNKKIDLIVSSPLHRTKQTASILGKATGAKVICREGLRDIDPGIFQGKSIETSNAYFKDELEKFVKPSPEGESRNDAKRRMWNVFLSLNREYQNKRIIIVGHGDPLWMLKGVLEGLSNEKMLDLPYPQNGALYGFAWKNLPRDGEGNTDFHRPYVDEIAVRCEKCGGGAKRVPEVVDVWFDSGAMPFAQGHWPFAQNQKSKIKDQKVLLPREYPADYIAEGMDQTRGWFYTLLAVATALGYEAPYKNVVSLGLINDKFGRKMSKSKGNVVEPFTVIDKYGADAVRWYFYTVNPPGETKNFDEQELQKTFRQFHLILWNSLVFWKTYALKKSDLKFKISDPKNLLDKWILARLNEVTEAATRNLENYEIRDAALAIGSFIDDLSRWYIRRSRRRFQPARRSFGEKGREGNQRDYREASATLGFVIRETAKLVAPFTPFFAEAIFSSFGKESVHLADWPTLRSRSGRTTREAERKLLKGMTEVRRIASIVLAKRAEAGIKVRQPLGKLVLGTKNSELKKDKRLLQILADEVNVKSVVFDKKLKENIGLDLMITPELKAEGILRELVRAVQDLRQGAGFSPKDKIIVMAELPKTARAALERYEKLFLDEVGARFIEYKRSDKFKAEIAMKIEGEDAWLAVRKT